MGNKTETIEEALSGFNVYDSESKVKSSIKCFI